MLTLHERAEQLRPKLECTGVDDHDEPVCFKCDRIIAAIESALREQIEACAKVADKRYDGCSDPGALIAAAIRRLKEER